MKPAGVIGVEGMKSIDAELARINAGNPKQRIVVEYFGDLSRVSCMRDGWEKPSPVTARSPHAETLADLCRLAVVQDI